MISSRERQWSLVLFSLFSSSHLSTKQRWWAEQKKLCDSVVQKSMRRSVDFSDPDIQKAWQEVRDDASDSNWILLSIGENGAAVLNGKGNGGLNEMKNQLNDNQAFCGVLRVRAVDDHGSKRAKFVFITFIGTGVPTIRRARFSAQKSEFERLFNGYHANIYVTSVNDLSEEEITKLLESCAGAHKPQAYEFS